MSLVVVGSVALDTVEAPTGRRERILGGAASFFSVAASHFTHVKLVGVVGEDFPEEHIELLARHDIDLEGLERAAGKTFHWSGRYSADLSSRESLATELNVFANFAPELPASYRGADFVFLANIHPELQARVCRQMERPKLIACDTMNYWIETEPKALAETLKLVDLLVINDEEVRQLTGEHNLVRASRAALGMGPKILVVKKGEHGALLFRDKEIFAVPALPLDDVVDPTGAGDTFAGGMMGHIARTGGLDSESLRQAMAHGTVAASYAVRDFSLDGLLQAAKLELDARLEGLRLLIRF